MKGSRRREIGKRLVKRKEKQRRAKKKHGGRTPVVRVAEAGEMRERCVLLMADEAWGCESKVIAWYPDKGEAALVSNTQLLMPPMFRPLDSCAGFVCGLHSDCLDEFFNWKFRVVVSNPATKYMVELPVLDVSQLPAATNFARAELTRGNLRLVMTPPRHQDQLFCVHLTTSCSGKDTVHSFNTSCWRWETSTTFSGKAIGSRLVGELLFRQRNLRSYDVATGKWTAIAGPEEGRNWDADFPVPERFSGSTYTSMVPFRYGDRIMAACTMSYCDFVLLELLVEGECRGWKVVTTADPCDFPSSPTGSNSGFMAQWPAVGGDLLVLPWAGFSRPLCFNIKYRKWIQLPAPLAASSFSLNCACVYDMTSLSKVAA